MLVNHHVAVVTSTSFLVLWPSAMRSFVRARCELMSFILSWPWFNMRSSLSLKVASVMGLGVRGPRFRQLPLPPPPHVMRLLGVPSGDSLFTDPCIDWTRLPKIGVSWDLTNGNTIGRFVVITATNVSLTAQDPANCAPLTGSLINGLVSTGIHTRYGEMTLQ